jgi:hypothetical protein
MLDKARAHRLKNRSRAKREDLPLLDTTKAREALQSVTKHWPEVRAQIQPYLAKGREKIGDIYSSVAQALAAKKEAFEDRLAEKRESSGPAAPKKPKAHSVHPAEKGEA